jgi:hypothetical protein
MSRVIRSTKFWLFAAVVAAGLAGTAYATIPGGDGVIHGCYAKSGGTLRVIDASVTSCKSGETALNWSQQGQPGPQGPQGEPGPAGPQGEPGEPGDFPDRLPSEKTVRGAYSAFATGDGSDLVTDAISFGFALSSAPTAHFIEAGGSPNPNCPGTAATPEADPGHLCIYEGESLNAGTFFDDPLTGATGGAVRPFGAEVAVRRSDGDGDFGSRGSWAVTAP